MAYRIHPLVPKIRPNGTSGTSRLPLIGYLGEKSNGGVVRLYLDLTLSRYYLVPEAAITDVIPLNNGDFAPDYVLLESGTDISLVEETSSSSENRAAKLVSGGLASAYLSNAGKSFAAASGVAAMSTYTGSSAPCQMAVASTMTGSSGPCQMAVFSTMTGSSGPCQMAILSTMTGSSSPCAGND